jgi:hypothetical protein
MLLRDECIITPEGYGFSCPTSRILKESGRGQGFYKASASESVIDVMEAITSGTSDVALVFQGDELLGLFTEADYIKVRSSAYSSLSSRQGYQSQGTTHFLTHS